MNRGLHPSPSATLGHSARGVQGGAAHQWRLVRERILAHLARLSERQIVLVTGPAGSGKSVALRQFLARHGGDNAVYVVGADTASLLSFLRGLTEALEPLVPGASLSLAIAYERAMQAPAPATELAAWFGEHLQGAGIRIVIDGLQYANAPGTAEFLSRAIAAAPASVRWIVATRTSGDLPVASWLAHGLADVPMTEADLRFSAEELAALARNVAVSVDVASRLLTLTGGWPAAAALGLVANERLDSLPAFVSPDAVYAVLAASVFSARDEATQDALLRTGVFAEFDAALLDAIGLPPETAERLADSPVVENLPDGRLRYTELFRDFLRGRLADAGKEIERAVIAEAAAACERVGRVRDALELYKLAGDAPAQQRILAAHGFSLIDGGASDVVEASIAALDAIHTANDPPILALKGLLDSQRARFDSSEAWFQLAIQDLANDPLRASVVYRYTLDLLRRGRIDCIDVLEPFIASAPADQEFYPFLCGTLATAYAIEDRFDDARALIAVALAGLRPSDPTPLRARAYHQTAYVALRCGDIADARENARRVLELAVPQGLYDLAARAHSILYEIAYAWDGDTKAALEHIEQTVAFGLKSADTRLRQWALLAAYYIEAEAGNAAAMRAIERALDTAEVVQDGETGATLLPGRALKATWSGDFFTAFRLLMNTADTQISPDRRALRWAEIALFGAVSGQLAAARDAARASEMELGHAHLGKHYGQAAAYLIVALSYLNDRDGLARVRSELKIAKNNRSLEAVTAAADAIDEQWHGRRDAKRLIAAMGVLRELHFGGIAAMFEALPARSSVH